MQQKSQRNLIVDLYKILLAIFVMFIHIPYSNITQDSVAIYRLAVAGFAAISGYYIFSNKLSYEEKLQRAKKFLINSLKYFGIAVVFSFVSQIIYAWIVGLPTKEGLRSFAFEIAPFLHKVRPHLPAPNVFFQLWYLQGLVFVAAIYLFLVWLKIDVVMFALPLLALPLYWAQTKWPFTQNFNYQFLYRNSWFMMLPSFAGGWIAGHFKKAQFSWYIYGILAVLLAGFIVLQIRINRRYPIEMTFIAVIISSLTIFLLDRIPKFPCKPFYLIFGNKFYLIVYFIHVFVGSYLRDKTQINPYAKPGLLILCTFVCAIVITQIINLIKVIVNLQKQKRKEAV